MLKARLNDDLKAAMLARDAMRTEVLKSLKSAITYEEVALKIRDTGLSDEQAQTVIQREAKKRAESAELYDKAGQAERAAAERAEKAIIDAYLPAQLSDDELEAIVSEAIAACGAEVQMGQVIGTVKSQVGTAADGARIAACVKAKLNLA